MVSERSSRYGRRSVGQGLAALLMAGSMAAGCVPDGGEPAPSTTTTTTSTTTTTTTTSTTTTTTTTPPVVWEPEIVVSSTDGLDPDGQTVTVTGTGFNPAAHLGTRPPLKDQPSGVYVTFGKFADAWQPSSGAAASTRQVLSQVWALPQAAYDALGGAATPGLALLSTDGTFTATLNVAPSTTGTNAYGVAVYPGSGALNPAQELLVRTTFAPKITVSKSADLTDGETVTVSGVGFLPSVNGTRPPLSGRPSGVYVAFGRFGDPWRPSAGAPGSSRQILSQKWAMPQASYDFLGGLADTLPINPDGSFTTTVTATNGGTSTNPFAFAVYPASGASNAGQELLIPASFAAVE